jgi:hypothetical protein
VNKREEKKNQIKKGNYKSSQLKILTKVQELTAK